MKKASIFILTGLLLGLLFAGRLAAQATQVNTVSAAHPVGWTGDATHFWLTQRLTSPAQFADMGNRSLALDAAGHPHVVYGLNAVYYAWYDGKSWHREIVDMVNHHSGTDASLALDQNGAPHVVYTQKLEPGDGRVIRYATRAGNHWFHLPLATGHVYFPSIALDNAGYPHVAFYNGDDGTLHHSYETATGWVNEVVDQITVHSNTSLVFDESGILHLSFMGNQELLYAAWDGNQWQIDPIATIANPDSVLATSISLNSEGQPAVAYQDGGGVHYALRHTAGWGIGLIDGDPGSSWLSLAFTPEGFAFVTYYDSFPGQLMMAFQSDACACTWLFAGMDGELHSGRYNAIAISQQGQLRITYVRDYTNLWGQRAEELRYFPYNDDTGGYMILETGGRHDQPRLAIDSANRLHTVYHDVLDKKLHYLRQTEAGWLDEAIEVPLTQLTNVDPALSFLLDANDNPHIIYFDSYHFLRHLHLLNNQWLNDSITFDPNYDLLPRQSSFALDSNQQPHVAFHGVDTDALYYAYQNGPDWVIELIETPIGANGLDSLTLRLDSLDHPHIVYTAASNDQLRYAQRPDGQWLVETVTNQADTASLALDSQDKPHIAYDGSADGQLYYTYWTGSDWFSELLGAGSDPVQLVLDGDDHPHIAYRLLSDNTRLKYTYNEGNGWVTHQADSRYSTGNELSLILNNQDVPVMLHLDEHNGHILLSNLAASTTYAPLILKP